MIPPWSNSTRVGMRRRAGRAAPIDTAPAAIRVVRQRQCAPACSGAVVNGQKATPSSKLTL
jgi:hypothetical protein